MTNSNFEMSTSPGFVIFASGSGTNAEQIIRYFHERKTGTPLAVFCNNPKAGVIERANKLGVPVFLFAKNELSEEGSVISELRRLNPELIVLAGFILQIPPHIIQAFPNRIINLHPALLPKYGGKGMYGEHVHKAVLEAGEKESGMTIHYVTENYDEGGSIFQATTLVMPDDTPYSLQQRIHKLEHEHFPKVVERLLKHRP